MKTPLFLFLFALFLPASCPASAEDASSQTPSSGSAIYAQLQQAAAAATMMNLGGQSLAGASRSAADVPASQPMFPLPAGESVQSQSGQIGGTPGVSGGTAPVLPTPSSLGLGVDASSVPSLLDREGEGKKDEDKAKDDAERKERESKEEQVPSASTPDSAMRRVLAEMRAGRLDVAVARLDALLEADPRNAQAHYLKAVVLVMTRHYSLAADEYRATLRTAAAPELAALARHGLEKLNH